MQEYIIKQNPKDNPVYPYSHTSYYIELLNGEFKDMRFSFNDIKILEEDNVKKIKFDYNLLYIPEGKIVDEAIENVVGEVLQDIIQRGNYELDTE